MVRKTTSKLKTLVLGLVASLTFSSAGLSYAQETTVARLSIAQNISLDSQERVFIPVDAIELGAISEADADSVVIDFKKLKLSSPYDSYYEVFLVTNQNGENHGHYVGNLDFFGILDSSEQLVKTLNISDFVGTASDVKFDQVGVALMLRPVDFSKASDVRLKKASPSIGEIEFRAIDN